MAIRDWLRPPRQVLAIFLAVAALSTAALGWLTWRLLDQDAQLETQRERMRLEQAADATVAAMQQSMAALISLVAQAPDDRTELPPEVSVISITDGALTVRPAGSVPYLPVVPPRVEAPSNIFEDGEQAEYRQRDFRRAAHLYIAAARSEIPAVRAGALARLGRVRRAVKDVESALEAYAALESIGGSTTVFGLPAALIASVGRMSALAEASRAQELRGAAESLARDLATGRWPLLRSEYESYAAQARQHVPDSPPASVEALARAEALEWVWQNRGGVPSMSQRLVSNDGRTALAVCQGDANRMTVVVASRAFLAALCGDVTGSRCAMSDLEGRTVIGEAPQNINNATRAAATTKLPWTVHVFPDRAAGASASSRSRGPLLSILAGVAVVLGAGWYFILRAISREVRVARLQTDFVAAVSHEFRSPLTSLSHISEMLAGDRVPTDELRRQSYGVLVRDTDRLRRLVETLLDVGRFESGVAAFRREPADLSALVRDTVAEFQERVRAEGYVVNVSSHADGLRVEVDREALSRAIWNLLDNAVKYSPDARAVHVEIGRDADHVSVAVRDEGLGIPAHERKEIFQRFVRGAESKARRIRGTGIGLALVRQIVRAHGGDVDVTSEVGRGSTFRMVLPISAAAGEISTPTFQPTGP